MGEGRENKGGERGKQPKAEKKEPAAKREGRK
jgi:hypothetical protein